MSGQLEAVIQYFVSVFDVKACSSPVFQLVYVLVAYHI